MIEMAKCGIHRGGSKQQTLVKLFSGVGAVASSGTQTTTGVASSKHERQNSNSCIKASLFEN